MLLRLTLTNIKSRLRDYTVLLAGLIMSSAIFYMFANLATNQAFIKANAAIKFASFIFAFGEVLLTIITLVYVLYANTFLLNMRQHDYGLFMMLGAKKRRVGLLMVLETLFIGMVATIIGIILGIGLTGAISQLLFNQLGLEIHHFNPIFLNAIVTTFVLYLVLFILASVINLSSLLKTPVLKLLKQSDSVDKIQVKGVRLFTSGVIGIALLAIGYLALAYIKVLQLMAIPIALVTIVLGSYLLFRSSMVLIFSWLKRRPIANKGLNNFTLSQIMFRIRDYTKILTITSLLFALALGAITVGMAFNREVSTMANSSSPYTLAINDPSATQKHQIDQLKDASTITYDQKISNGKIIYNEAQFKAQPFKIIDPKSTNMGDSTKFIKVSVSYLKKHADSMIDLNALNGSKQMLKAQFVDSTTFNTIAGTTHQVTLVNVDSIAKNRKLLDKLNNEQLAQHTPLYEGLSIGSFQTFLAVSAIFGGLEFIGFFLGIAFLAMLASCLMFKILSGTQQDVLRYNMLTRIGTRRKLITKSINREIFVLFAVPGILGIIDVLFGLQMFKSLLPNPYTGIQYPLVIFVLLYLIYYFLTTWLYKLIVLPNK